MITLRFQPHHLPSAAVPGVAGVPEPRAFWCGRSEGWLSQAEFIRRTEEAIACYAVAQPLRFRAAIAGCARHFPRKAHSALRRRKTAI